MWTKYNDGKEIGTIGTENGKIILDEEYKGFCHVTLEENAGSAPYAITCGIYGLFVHTTYAGEDDGIQMYEEMKNALAEFIDNPDDEDNWCEWFVNKF